MIPAARRLGAFEVLYALKSGGMGEVLLARRRGPGGFEQLVALKTIRSDLTASQSVRDMFLDEARLLARLAHPAIATVVDFGDEGGELYLAMEYVRGIRFGELAARRPPPAIVARAVAEACRGLHAAHELTDLAGNPLGVVHRDISPENLMLGFDGQVKVLDFGIALVKGRTTVTEHGTVKGKPPYMSPEQVRGERLDRKSDVFSVALVLHEMLTGEPVFGGDNVYAVARAVIEQELTPPGVSAELDAAVMRALVRDPVGRTSTAQALAEQLEAVASGESLAAWAARELAAERDLHRVWLAEVVAGRDAPRPVGRASGMLTARAQTPEPVPVPQSALGVPVPDPVPPNRAWLAIPIVAAAIIAAMLFLVCTSHRSASPPPDAGTVVVIAPPDASPPPLPVAIDAAPPDVPVDASVRVRHNKRTPPPIDAGVVRQVPDASVPSVAAPPGFITITSDPFALIRIDGKDWGTTPIYKRKIAAGSHTVDLVSPDSHDVRLHRTVDIASGKLQRIDL